MVESDDPGLPSGIRSLAKIPKFGLGRKKKKEQPAVLPLIEIAANPRTKGNDSNSTSRTSTNDGSNKSGKQLKNEKRDVDENLSSSLPPAAPPPREGTAADDGETTLKPEKLNIAIRFYHTSKEILLSSIMNVLLVFVPVGIAINFAGVSPSIVFAINAIAIIPLAGLLSHATETVAVSLGDTLGALLNVSFGNAVELIIFIIALAKNEIRIVQASLIGSILSNLLLILGMCFLFGGLRFREQIYNSTVTQLSACLLSLSVTSLLLPTAFHASFSISSDADTPVLALSRGTSVILLLVYVLYLLFQLKSHSYMYESTPQHVIDEESYPGVLADLLNSSTSSDTSSSSSDSDSTSGSYRTANRIKKLMRRRRKSSVSSVEIPSLPSKPTRSSSVITNSDRPSPIEVSENRNGIQLGAIASSNEADTDGEHDLRHTRSAGGPAITYRDFEAERVASVENVDSIEQDDESKDKQKKHKKKRGFRRHHRKHKRDEQRAEPSVTVSASTPQSTIPHAPLESVAQTNTPQIGFAEDTNATGPGGSKRAPGMARIPRPTLNKMLGATVFSSTYAAQSGPAIAQKPVVVRAPYGLRRTSSLPDRLNIIRIQSQRPTDQLTRVTPDSSASKAITSGKGEEPKKHMSRTSAILLLLVSTALVAVCANFLVGSIDYLVNNSSVTQTFIGLIVLPIVGNAAEHVTAVTVASKNKMDLAIGVAVGSSIQIALFVTPIVVLLGWILQRNMSLYFSLFETVSLFVSAFIVNFLVLDGRSNYLEGALLCAAYTIIAVAAFYYPNCDASSGASCIKTPG